MNQVYQVIAQTPSSLRGKMVETFLWVLLLLLLEFSVLFLISEFGVGLGANGFVSSDFKQKILDSVGSINLPLYALTMPIFLLFFLAIMANFKVSYLSNAVGMEIGVQIADRYLSSSEEERLHFRSSDFINTVIQESSRISLRVYFPLLQMVVKSLNLVVVLVVMMVSSFEISALLVLGLFCYYSVFVFAPKRALRRVSKLTSELNRSRYSALDIITSSFIDLVLFGKERLMLERLRSFGAGLAKNNAIVHAVSVAPRLGLEYGLAGLLLVLFFLSDGINQSGELYFISFVAIFRVFPLIQAIFTNYTSFRAHYTAFFDSINYLSDSPQLKAEDVFDELSSDFSGLEAVGIQKEFVREDGDEVCLGPWSFELPSAGFISISGVSGSGKSSLIKILMGVTRPSSGAFLIDGKVFSPYKNKSWQRMISYVDQKPILFSGSIRDNMNFLSNGYVTDEVLTEALVAAGFDLQAAGLSLDSEVGDKGSLLSGGQCQRVAIARAFASGRPIMVLDEPTSALNKEKEAEVIKSLQGMSSSRLILVVSHSASLLKESSQNINMGL